MAHGIFAVAHEILVPRPGIESGPHALGVSAREVPSTLFGDYNEAFLVSVVPIRVPYGTVFISLYNTNQTLYKLLAPFHWTRSRLVHHHILEPRLVPGSEHRFRNCVRVLHRNRTNRICIYLSTYLPTYLYTSLFLKVNSNTHLLISFRGGKRERFFFVVCLFFYRIGSHNCRGW